MKTAEELYKFLIRKVHPDLNPNLPNATRKTQDVNSAKGNFFALKNLAIKWGYIKGKERKLDMSSFDEIWNVIMPKGMKVKDQFWKKISFMRNGTIVNFRIEDDKVGGKNGVVVASKKILKGKFKGEFLYTIYIKGYGLFDLKIHSKDLGKYFSNIQYTGFNYNPLYNEGKIALDKYNLKKNKEKGSVWDIRV